jgi:hypothetical protein
LSRRVRKVVGYPPFPEMSDLQHREFHEALLDADPFEDLPGGGSGDPEGRREPAQAADRVGRLLWGNQGLL